MKEIPLTQGQVTLVDDEDYEWLSQWKWCAAWDVRTRSFRACRTEILDGKRHPRTMHGLIMKTHPGQEVDHVNHNTLDNRRENLRLCDHCQNQANQRKHADSKSPYKGICWHARHKKWMATIHVRGVHTHLGYFKTPEEAARAYDAAAKERWGEFACINGV